MRTTFNMKYAQSLDSIISTQDKLQTSKTFDSFSNVLSWGNAWLN